MDYSDQCIIYLASKSYSQCTARAVRIIFPLDWCTPTEVISTLQEGPQYFFVKRDWAILFLVNGDLILFVNCD